LVEAFGFEAGGVERNVDGHVTTEHHLDSPLSAKVANSGLVVHVDDVDTAGH